MKKEYFLAIVIGFFILAQVLDYLAGPVYFPISSPYSFFNQLYLNQYPLTAVAIVLRALALFISTVLIFSLFEKAYFVKSIILFVIGSLAQLYAIQQLKTGLRTTSIQWTLSIAYATLLYLFPLVVYLILGLIHGAKEKINSLDKIDNEKTN